MNSFNPSKYSTTSSEIGDDSIDMSEEVVEKGHKNILKVDIGKFEELCKKFKEKKDLKIKKLIGEDKVDFDLMVSYVHLLYGTNYYSHLFEKVKKHFKNTNNIKPGTIGGYFAGCLTGKNQNLSGCALSCAGSMPLPKEDEEWSFCDKAVIMAEKGNDGYVFSIVKPAESVEDFNPAYLFVESNSLNDFSGFNNVEKANLKAMGCKKVKLIGYASDMNSSDMKYSELYKEPKNIEEIKNRRKKRDIESNESSNESNNGWLIFAVIVFILLLLLLLFLLYRYSKM